MPAADHGGAGSLGRWLGLPWHALAVSLYPPLWFIGGNPDLFVPSDAARPAIVLMILIAVLAGVLYPLLRHFGRAMLASSAAVGTMMLYAPLRLAYLGDLDPLSARLAGVGLVVGGAFAIGWMVSRLGRRTPAVVQAVNVTALTLMLFPLHAAVMNDADEPRSDDGHRSSAAIVDLNFTARPNIYHVVLDGYARADVLKALYGHDNGGFEDALRSLGFAVPDESVAPYGQSLLTMNAVLSMAYLDDDIARLKSNHPTITNKQLRQTLHRRFAASPVRRVLEDAGYRILSVESAYPPLTLRSAEHVFRAQSDILTTSLLERSVYVLAPFGHYLIHGVFGGRSDSRDRVRFGLDLPVLENQPAPYFLFNHILAPHPPFDIARDGGPRRDNVAGFPDGDHWSPGDGDRDRLYREGYIEKLSFTNRRILDWASRTIADTPGPLIIILHGDHGSGLRLVHDDLSSTCAKERFSPFLAVYYRVPGSEIAMPEPMNLVNLYRVVFDALSDANVPLLDDRSYFAPWSDPGRFQRLPIERRDAFGESCQALSGAG